MILQKNKGFMGPPSRHIASPKSAFNPGKMSVSRIGGNVSNSGGYDTRSQMSGSSTGSMGGGLASRFSLALSRVIDQRQIIVDSSNLKQNDATESTEAVT